VIDKVPSISPEARDSLKGVYLERDSTLLEIDREKDVKDIITVSKIITLIFILIINFIKIFNKMSLLEKFKKLNTLSNQKEILKNKTTDAFKINLPALAK